MGKYISQTNNPLVDVDSTANPETRDSSNIHWNENIKLSNDIAPNEENVENIELSQEEEDRFYDKVMKTTLL